MWKAVLVILLVVSPLRTAGAEEAQEQQIRRLTEEALRLRAEGKVEEAQRLVAEADEVGGGRAVPAGGNAGDGIDAAKEFQAGLEAMSGGNLVAAAEHFRKVVVRDPNSFEAHNNLAVIYAEQGKDDQALEELRKVLELRPDYYRGRKNLAELYAQLASQAFVEAASVAPPGERTALLERARILATQGTEAPTVPPERRPEKNEEALVATAPPPETPVVAQPVKKAAPLHGPSQRARQLLALGDDGAYLMVVAEGTLWLYEQRGGRVELASSFPVEAGQQVPSTAVLYVATSTRNGIALRPIAGSGRRLTLRSSGPSATGLKLDAEALAKIAAVVRPNRTPLLVVPQLDLADTDADKGLRDTVLSDFRSWSTSWSDKKLEPYVDSYIPTYAAKGAGDNAAWRKQRARIFSASGNVSVEHSTPAMIKIGDEVILLTDQRYRSELQTSTGVKELTWVQAAGGWRISQEEMISERIE